MTQPRPVVTHHEICRWQNYIHVTLITDQPFNGRLYTSSGRFNRTNRFKYVRGKRTLCGFTLRLSRHHWYPQQELGETTRHTFTIPVRSTQRFLNLMLTTHPGDYARWVGSTEYYFDPSKLQACSYYSIGYTQLVRHHERQIIVGQATPIDWEEALVTSPYWLWPWNQPNWTQALTISHSMTVISGELWVGPSSTIRLILSTQQTGAYFTWQWLNSAPTPIYVDIIFQVQHSHPYYDIYYAHFEASGAVGGQLQPESKIEYHVIYYSPP